MSWDAALDQNGDWIFSGNRDILQVDGNALTQQRIMTRLKIPRGTFVFDETSDLGSELQFALRYNTDRAQREIPGIVQRALEPMSDEISVTSVTVSLSTNQRQLVIDIRYQHRVTEENTADVPSDTEERSLLFSL